MKSEANWFGLIANIILIALTVCFSAIPHQELNMSTLLSELLNVGVRSTTSNRGMWKQRVIKK